MAHDVVLIPGDGIGPEITQAMRRVVEATGVQINWNVQEAGAGVMDEFGTPLPQHVLDAVAETKVAIKGPITTPVGTGFRSVNVALRKHFDLYACVRPCLSQPGDGSRFRDVDLVIVRENTEDLYAGIEFDEGAAEVEELSQLVERSGQKTFAADSAISIKPISIAKSRRIDVILHCGRHTKFLFHDLLYRHACVSRNIAVRIKNASIFRIHFPGSADPDRFKIVIGMDQSFDTLHQCRSAFRCTRLCLTQLHECLSVPETGLDHCSPDIHSHNSHNFSFFIFRSLPRILP